MVHLHFRPELKPKGFPNSVNGLRWFFVGLLSFVLAISSASMASGQFPDLTKSNQGSLVPKGVSRLGEYEVTTVNSPIDDRALFEIASPTIFDRSNPPEGRIPVEIRAQEIEERLKRESFRLADKESLASQTPTVEITTLNNRPILVVANPQKSRSLKLVTVTEPDAEYHSETLEALAEQWQAILQKEVDRQAALVNPQVLVRKFIEASLIFLAILLATTTLLGFRWQLYRRQKALKAQKKSQIAAAQATLSVPQTVTKDVASDEPNDSTVPSTRSHFLTTLRSFFTIQHHDWHNLFQWLSFWLLVLTWYFGLYAVLSRLPFLMKYSSWVLAAPLRLLFIWFSLSLTIRVSRWLIDRGMKALEGSRYINLGEVERQSLRTLTVTSALKGLITFIFIAIGVIWTLDLLNIPTGSILAGGAILGLAVSFGSQNLIKDLVNGCLILAEDQFAVGDVIDLGDVSGMVETMNLRITQLRNSDGELITVPNSAITKVRNLTRLWSRLDFTIEVSYENNPKKVLALLEEIAMEMYNEPGWQQYISEPPEVLGLESLSPSGMTARVWIKTAPLQQWSVGREYRLRVRQAFEANGIKV